MTATTTDRPGLDTAELEGIVRLCVNFGVKSLKFRGLEVEFGLEPREIKPPTAEPEFQSRNPVKEITAEEHKRMNAEAIAADELSLKEQQVADLFLADPRAAEEMIINGELDDADDDESGEPE